ncbi:kinase-like domain-containing protein [Sporodiniella umbellata]|nr:kinase-like domain-containing protein [Sporodiniella umbellata]
MSSCLYETKKQSALSGIDNQVIIADRWNILGRIGKGSFGEVFEAKEEKTKKKYAIKREPCRMKKPQVRHEYELYQLFRDIPGIPKCYWNGHFEEFDCIAMDLLGPSLGELKEATLTMSIPFVVEIGCQMISLMEAIHNQGYVYRDIKPSNFLFSADFILPEPKALEVQEGIECQYPSCEEVFGAWAQKPQLFLIDFGLAKRWQDPENGQHLIEVRKAHKKKAGTARYASLNVHRNQMHTRRDDMESIGYLLLDLIVGGLPWAGIQAQRSQMGWDRIKKIKEDIFLEDFYAGLPQGFLKYMEHTRHLKFAQKPDYSLFRSFLTGSLPQGPYAELIPSPLASQTEKKEGLQKIASSHQAASSLSAPALTSQKQQNRVGWYAHKYEQEPWIPVVDWTNTTPDQSTTQNEVGWEKQDKAWSAMESTWASTVVKPWE